MTYPPIECMRLPTWMRRFLRTRQEETQPRQTPTASHRKSLHRMSSKIGITRDYLIAYYLIFFFTNYFLYLYLFVDSRATRPNFGTNRLCLVKKRLTCCAMPLLVLSWCVTLQHLLMLLGWWWRWLRLQLDRKILMEVMSWCATF